jgi:TniB protein
VAVPDSLAAWREFVNRRNIEPAHLTIEQIRALSPVEKERYDQARFAWLGADVVLETPDTETLTRQTRVLIARNTAQTATARRGLAISGSAGRGKSTAALLIGRRHERMMRTKLARDDDGFAPVVYTVVPPGTTPKMMMLAFANFLGLLVPGKATAQDLTEQIVGVMRALSVSLVLVDEVHNLKTNHQGGSDAASALKVFSERLDATFIYAGIDLLPICSPDTWAANSKAGWRCTRCAPTATAPKPNAIPGPNWSSASKHFCPSDGTPQDPWKPR